MIKQRKINHRGGKSKKSDNPTLSTSTFNSGIECSVERSNSTLPTISSVASVKKCNSYAKPEQLRYITAAPKNAAVHFGKFYGLHYNAEKMCHGNRRNRFPEEEEPAGVKSTRRSEFTRQMVHKLERAGDTGDYARQLSILLEKTVEPPNFKLNPLLPESSIPRECQGTLDYPLWYKESHEIPLVFSNPVVQPNA